MTGSAVNHRQVIVCAACLLAFSCVLTGCGKEEQKRVQGYVEGEFVYIASPFSGALEELNVTRGDRVKRGDSLFALDSVPEKAAWVEAKGRLTQGQATLDDAMKGKRPSEIQAIEAQLEQTRAALAFSEKELTRQEKLIATRATSTLDLDRARSARDQDRQRKAALEADLRTARLGSRDDQVAAAAANLHALEGTMARAGWDLSQKRQSAPQAGLVFDTLYRRGEWVAAGRPVVVLLPPQNVKVRAFVAETKIGTLQPGEGVKVLVDGVKKPFPGRISFISPQAEYAPPVIFSNESRSKLVFMVEIIFDPAAAAQLHPGQPVDVEFGN